MVDTDELRGEDAILAALESRDPGLAASASAVHVAAVEQWLAASLRPGRAGQPGNGEAQDGPDRG
ncbi:DNA-binding FadR family transcriptional regulator [Streptacidiphilus sp. MAP12-33]|uniref:hypothetical protein n=1 Tax=Streptacidiphilus sp. MAP12-33 TaxID=3156266 RepID=UPI0035159CCD